MNIVSPEFIANLMSRQIAPAAYGWRVIRPSRPMRMRALLPAFLVIVLLSGQARAVAPLRSALLGIWEEDPGTCEGDNFVSYRRDGAFFGYDYEGRWVLKGGSLQTTVTKRMDTDETWRRVRQPQRSVTTIVSLTHDRLTERWPDGSLHQSHRCR